ncbi:MAG: hypothetical protein U0821_03960 [Chloroflexota bacterium]
MSGPFIVLTEPQSAKGILVNAAMISCVAPHGRRGSYVFLSGNAERVEAEETPGQIALMLQATGIECHGKAEL